MSFNFGNKSNERLASVKPQLAAVVRRALELTTQDFFVLEGRRTKKAQQEYFGAGRTAAELKAAGVDPSLARPSERQKTWTLNSKHLTGDAVDVCPWPVDWDTLSKFDAIAKAMFAAAKELKTPIRWGHDWDRDGIVRERGESDGPHFELL